MLSICYIIDHQLYMKRMDRKRVDGILNMVELDLAKIVGIEKYHKHKRLYARRKKRSLNS